MTIALGSCTDDFGYGDYGLGEGETVLTLDASFSPFSEGSMTRGASTAGNALADLNDLVILVYDGVPDEDGNYQLLPEYSVMEGIDTSKASDYDRDPNGNNGAANGKPAEATTKTLSDITLSNIPFGKYYIIGVANLKGGTKNYLESHVNDTYNYKTLDGLRRMKMTWNDVDVEGESVVNNIATNGEMLGYFADAESDHVPTSNSSFAPVFVNRHGISLHAWLRRCASKITIDFDGSGLRENVYVYIKEARICDVPTDCTLGFGSVSVENTRSEVTKDYNNRVEDDGSMRQSGQVISYLRVGADSVNHNIGWPCISKGTPKIKDNSNDNYSEANDREFHKETSYALFFYENMQGEQSVPGKMHTPNTADDHTPSGGLVPHEKDEMKYGTYIEVEGYYHSDADKNVTEGKIVYRFMLGKNAVDDYDAERNYHYRLTLCPTGNGNDCDWHIDYDEKTGFNVPNPWYVSYLYNQDARLPFKYVPKEGYEVIGMKAEIIQNPWYPTKANNDYDLTNPSFVVSPTARYGDHTDPYENLNNQINSEGKYINGNGFLSLRVSTNTVVKPEDCGLGPSSVDYNKVEDAGANDYHFYDAKSKGDYSESNRGPWDRSRRVYLENGDPVPLIYEGLTGDVLDDAMAREAFEYTVDKDEKCTFKIPLFTRAKVLLKKTGYSGNNPFVGYERVAKVKLTVTCRNKNDQTETYEDNDTVNVVQVRRVLNPKGVYRSFDNFEPFHVKLMWLDGDQAEEFNPIVSHGPWKAEVIGDANFITLDGKQSVSGSTNSNIDFTIRFNRMNNTGNNKYAVVRVLYHNYTCTHLIFVRQGDKAEKLSVDADEVEWSPFNMITKDKMATDPRDEGSLFKFGNPDEPIDVFNNIYTDDSGRHIYRVLSSYEKDEFAEYKDSVIKPFRKIDEDGNLIGGTIKWGDIYPNEEGFIGENAFGSDFEQYQVDDFETLYLNTNHEFGYGVLYADGATETKVGLNEAYGYYRRGDQSFGMRGVFAYYWSTEQGKERYNGRNVFFPIGRSGYGHRKNYKEGLGKEDGHGILRYSCAGGVPRTLFSDVAPLFVSICRSPGAIYWAREPKANAIGWDGHVIENGEAAYALDFNFFTFDVNCIIAANINMDGKGKEPYGDACFVRCKRTNPSPASAPRKGRRR